MCEATQSQKMWKWYEQHPLPNTVLAGGADLVGISISAVTAVIRLGFRLPKQSERSPKVVALFSATNFSSYIIELLQLHDTIQIKWNYA